MGASQGQSFHRSLRHSDTSILGFTCDCSVRISDGCICTPQSAHSCDTRLSSPSDLQRTQQVVLSVQHLWTLGLRTVMLMTRIDVQEIHQLVLLGHARCRTYLVRVCLRLCSEAHLSSVTRMKRATHSDITPKIRAVKLVHSVALSCWAQQLSWSLNTCPHHFETKHSVALNCLRDCQRLTEF